MKSISSALAQKSFELSKLKGQRNSTKESENRLMLRVELLSDISEALESSIRDSSGLMEAIKEIAEKYNDGDVEGIEKITRRILK